MTNKHLLQEFLKTHKVPPFRLKQILSAIYKEGKNSFESSRVLPKDLRKILTENFDIFSLKKNVEMESKTHNAIKTVFRLKDNFLVEGVLMKFKDGRNSVCVSSQVGCGLKCAFCATGAMGFKRNLTAEEIADQVLYFDHWLKNHNHAKNDQAASRVSHVVFMGMGEPFLNYNPVIEAVRALNDPDMLGIASRHITLSTAGIIPGIKKLADEPLQVNLAVSLHAPTQELREKLMPIAKSYKLPELMTAIKEYIQKTKRRVSYEYVMLKDKNDSPNQARELTHLLRGQMCHVNLIPYNETYLGFENAGKSRINEFKEILDNVKIPVTVRVSLGQDISAACGQLRLGTGNRQLATDELSIVCI